MRFLGGENRERRAEAVAGKEQRRPARPDLGFNQRPHRIERILEALMRIARRQTAIGVGDQISRQRRIGSGEGDRRAIVSFAYDRAGVDHRPLRAEMRDRLKTPKRSNLHDRLRRAGFIRKLRHPHHRARITEIEMPVLRCKRVERVPVVVLRRKLDKFAHRLSPDGVCAAASRPCSAAVGTMLTSRPRRVYARRLPRHSARAPRVNLPPNCATMRGHDFRTQDFPI
jgi:hypothetical protein